MAAKKNWDEKFEEVSKEFPLIKTFNWDTAVMSDTDLFTTLLSDVIKSGRKVKKPGKRPNLSRKDAEEKLSQLAAEDFSELEFKDAFIALSAQRSIRHVASKTGLDRNIVYGLLNGTRLPLFREMEQIAESFGKDPSFFLEYRVGYVLSKMNKFLFSSPETAAYWYKNFKSEILEIK
jgi:transcriptional regulator with XRE-family HTH domain